MGVVGDAETARRAGLVDDRRVKAEEGTRSAAIEKAPKKTTAVRVEYLEERQDVAGRAIHPKG